MSDFLKTLTTLNNNDETDVKTAIVFSHFDKCCEPWQEFVHIISILSTAHKKNLDLIQYLIYSFGQWKSRCSSPVAQEMFDEHFFLFTLPVDALRNFAGLFDLSQNYLISVLRRELLTYPIHSQDYKRILTIIVALNFQLEFNDNEILLPLILNMKDHLIHLFLDKRNDLENYLLNLLNKLYVNGGQTFRAILSREYQIRDSNLNKKAIKRLAIRFWNSLGNQRVELYSNLASLQDRSTLGYLIGVKYNSMFDEKTMSDECWNEAVDDVIHEKADLTNYLFELLTEKDDVQTLNYWLGKLNISHRNLSPSVQSFLERRRYNRTTILPKTCQQSKNFYRINLDRIRISFIDSPSGYQRLLDRLFRQTDANKQLTIGFDCEWKPIFRNSSTSKQRISVMQIAFDDEIFLLDLLHFFHTFDQQTIQKRLATRLFDDEHLTVLCYGFRSDMSMLISSYPVFNQALQSGKTLIDLALVHTELLQNRKDLFPLSQTNGKDKGLSEFVRLCFGRKLDKSEQCSNWERRPLRDAQTIYAATDAWCLLDVYHFLQNQLGQSLDYLQSFRGKLLTNKDEKHSLLDCVNQQKNENSS